MLLVDEKTDSGHTAPTSDAAGPSKSLPVAPPEYAEHEQAWQGAPQNLDTQISRYNQSRQSLTIERNSGGAHATNIEHETQEREAAVVDAMNNVADSHPDPGGRAKEFEEATEKEKDNLIGDIMKAVMTLITAPFVLLGLIFITTGAILNGIGTALTGGRYSARWRDSRGRGQGQEDLEAKD